MRTVSADDSGLARRVADLESQQEAISGVLRTVAGAKGVEPVLEEVVEACRRLCGADLGALWLLEDGLLHAAIHHGTGDAAAYDRAHPHQLDRTTVAGRTAVTRAPVNIPDIRVDAEYVYAGPLPYRAFLGVPILFEDDLIGVVVVVRHEPERFTDEQVVLVQTFADQAAIALTNARLIAAVERQRTELSRFLSPQVAELISSRDGERLLAGHRAYISCLFCDLRGFTAFAETAAPEELFDVLRRYHAALGELIPAHHGTLEHFAGDGVMVFFNDPLPVDDHELHAIRLALGYATLGRIGFEGRYDYGALGPVTNLASRLSTQAGAEQILIGPRLFAAVEQDVDATPVGRLELKGFGRPIAAHQIHRLRGD
jgi:adenylate cyclase